MSEKHARKYTNSIKKRLTVNYIRAIVAAIAIIVVVVVYMQTLFF
jgi:hypothetical protein